MAIPAGSTSYDGHELHMATNCLGPFLFTKPLTPLLQQTATSSPPGQVRISWAASLGIDVGSFHEGGIDMEASGRPIPAKNPQLTYGMSKVGTLFLASQYAYHHPLDRDTSKGVLSNAFNPGNLHTDLGRNLPKVAVWMLSATMLWPARLGAYTELYAGWSEELGRAENHGGYVIPWGRTSNVRKEVQRELDLGSEGDERSKAVRFWIWCEQETRAYIL